MQITARTRTKDLVNVLNESNVRELLDKVQPVPLEKTLMDMTIAEFADLMADEEGYILNVILNEKRALRAFGRLKQYRTEMESISKFMKMYDAKRSADEERAAKGILFPNIVQRMLIDCVRFFHLHSFDDAGKIKVSEWLTVFQDDASQAAYHRNYSKIIENKGKMKKGK